MPEQNPEAVQPEQGIEAFLEALGGERIEGPFSRPGPLNIVEAMATVPFFEARQKSIREQTVSVPATGEEIVERAPWPRSQQRSEPVNKAEIMSELEATTDEEDNK
jgi:hypothetical protein